jgi:hypothetical protein
MLPTMLGGLGIHAGRALVRVVNRR